MSASPTPAYASTSGMDAEEDGAGPSVVVVESDSAGPSATVTEVRNMVVLESKCAVRWCACVFLDQSC